MSKDTFTGEVFSWQDNLHLGEGDLENTLKPLSDGSRIPMEVLQMVYNSVNKKSAYEFTEDFVVYASTILSTVTLTRWNIKKILEEYWKYRNGQEQDWNPGPPIRYDE